MMSMPRSSSSTSSPTRLERISRSPVPDILRSIASTAVSMRSDETGRFLSASAMELLSFSRLYSARPPPFFTIQGMASEMRSKVVKRLPQLWH